MIALQQDRYQVDRHRKSRGVYAWVTVGFFNAHSPAEARRLARNAMANRICFLRAYPVGCGHINPVERKS